ncbi:Hsp20 family protein [Streptomyces sp. NPDC001553]|uniref:Hsp20 family protein n=1 Tax=Streptomyces sp. NPDC001553 TaxID=3154385 RepID=UPI00332DC6F6
MARWSWTSSSAALTSFGVCHGHGTRHSGRFGFQAVLPSGVKFEDVSAALADGVLTISVPWAQATTERVGERPP